MNKDELLKEKEETEKELKIFQKQSEELQRQLNIVGIKQQRLVGVIEFINKNVKHEMKRELAQKQADLKKMTRLISDLNEIGFKPTKDMEERFNERVKEVEALTQEIGIPDKPEKAKKKDKKNEVAIQPVE